MIDRRYLALAIPGVALAAAFLSPDGTSQEKPQRKHSEMHERMEAVEDHMRFLRRSLRDPEQDAASLEKIAAAEMELLVCKGLDPEMAAEVPEEERAAFLRDYRKEMVHALSELLKLETAVLDGDHETAQTIFKDVKRVEKAGHERFRPEEDH